ncbi:MULTISPECIES: toll/interleukin-1 receptor domain-containing protein [Pectobacterium]|uniref:toll/interleukin-1 receptor domain-containing protein n=1 Tax=Pectobacterium TaxID=122277 RepID=UPI00202D5DF5|nr:MULTISPECIES: TIR domain-containing protein [Pectobacterium]MCL6324726.1 TIR domain-containing protein [Pectobacterium polaris]WDF97537.1 TIR domain-containing protein [Pectobacterium carotovorum subsp. carotovorum]
MFNILISANKTAWEAESWMQISKERFKEYSGYECEDISLENPSDLKSLEKLQTFLLYENGVENESKKIRVGHMRDIKIRGPNVCFRFSENGYIPSENLEDLQNGLRISRGEMGRTHWAIKDGSVPQNIMAKVQHTPKAYDVVLSFAGEDRAYVAQVADYLESKGVDAFYDEYETTTLWGKDLVEHLESVYRRQGRFCIMFISKHYAEKMWTRHERKSALSRAIEERTEYVLPVRFDDTEIPGLLPTIGYLDLRQRSPEYLGERILEKLGR